MRPGAGSTRAGGSQQPLLAGDARTRLERKPPLAGALLRLQLRDLSPDRGEQPLSRGEALLDLRAPPRELGDRRLLPHPCTRQGPLANRVPVRGEGGLVGGTAVLRGDVLYGLQPVDQVREAPGADEDVDGRRLAVLVDDHEPLREALLGEVEVPPREAERRPVAADLDIERGKPQLRTVPGLDDVLHPRVEHLDLRQDGSRVRLLRARPGRRLRARGAGRDERGEDGDGCKNESRAHEPGERAPGAQMANEDPSLSIRRPIDQPYTEPMQETLDVSNDVAAELAGIGDGVLGALRDRLDCTIRLRGNQLTIEGDDVKVAEARAVVDELVELVESGQEVGAGTVDAVLNALDQAEDIRTIFEDVVWSHRGKRITPKTVTQKRYVDAIRGSTVTFAIGPAGTGKTYLAIALAVAALDAREVGRIILTRPAVEAGERLGFLPGDVLAKVDPYMRPLFDALYDMIDPEKLSAYIERGTIEVAPLAFMRGRTLNDSFIILDEAQNTSPEQMQMFLTRLGFGSKVVVTGDVTQIDLPREQASGLIQVQTILGSIDGIAFIRFGHEDVVRHKLVQRIVEAYKRHAEETGTQRQR